MKKTIITLLSIFMMTLSSITVYAQERPDLHRLDSQDQGRWLSIEARLSNKDSDGWDVLSKDEKKFLSELFNRLARANQKYGKNDVKKIENLIQKHLSVPSSSPISTDWLAKSLKTTEEYLALPFSEMSGDHLARLKQLYSPLVAQPGVRECLGKIETCNRCFNLYVDMEKALRAPYDKNLVPRLVKDITTEWNNMSKAQQAGIQEEYSYLNGYETAIKLFQDLIRATNGNDKLKAYRKEGADWNKTSALEEIHSEFNTYDSKAISKDSKGNNFRRYISHIEWLNKKFEEYKNTLERDPLHRVLPLEDDILTIKL